MTGGVWLQSLIMFVIEEHSHWRMILRPRARLYLGQGVGPGVVPGLAPVAVQVDVPVQVVSGGQHHDARVVNPRNLVNSSITRLAFDNVMPIDL